MLNNGVKWYNFSPPRWSFIAPPLTAACQDPICPLCEAYGDGYTAGKEKAYFEVRTWHPKEHAPSCGCNPCMAARSVIEKLTR